MIIDLINKTLQFSPSDKTQQIKIIETSEIRWYSHYQNKKNLAFITWDVLHWTNGEWVAQGSYIANEKYMEIKEDLSKEIDEFKRWMIVSINGLLLSDDTGVFGSIKMISQCKNKN